MIAVSPVEEIDQPVEAPGFLVELPSRPRVFFGNLRDLMMPRQLPPLHLDSSPDAFWPDVLVERKLPWGRFLQSIGLHVLAFATLIAFTGFFRLQPRVVAKPMFDRSDVIYYDASEYLPPLDTRSETPAPSSQADPELSPQPVIAVPPESDNRTQTIVTPPDIKLKRDVALPNIVAWSETTRSNPQLDIPPVPLTPAAEITRLMPQMNNSVAPPPDATRLTASRNLPTLQNSVVAPPPDVRASNAAALQLPQIAAVAPPPMVDATSARPLGELTIAQTSVIAPAPQLALSAQRSMVGAQPSRLGAPQPLPPPPSLASGSSSGSFGAQGRVIALNLHPAVGAPPNPPAGNRRGTFAATPEGHAGASGSPGSTAGNSAAAGPGYANGKETGSGATKKGASDVPSGLYVGSTPAKTSPVAGNNSSTKSLNPNLLASVPPPRVTSPARTMQPATAAKLSDAERAVFGNRKFYALTLNMPNLNSSGGSWVIHFAELDHDSSNHAPSNSDANSAELSQPAATRKVDPAYPLQLMHENVSGTVILVAIIRADGRVSNVRVLRGVDERLDRFASQAIAQWQFQPATKNGSAVDVEATFQIPFRPQRTGF